MSKQFQHIKALSLIVLLAFCSTSWAQKVETAIVKISSPAIDSTTLSEAIKATGFGEFKLERTFPHHRSPLNKVDATVIDLSLFYNLELPSDPKLDKRLDLLEELDEVQYAERKPIAEVCFTPNDPELGLLWGLNKIQAFDAWNIQKGDTSVVVGVNDTGTDLDHPDLQSEMAHNLGDPVNGIDDDQDGYIDNNIGWDFTDNNRNPQSTQNDHGIHVSGISSGATNNGQGIASAGFRTKFMTARTGVGTAIVYGYEGIVYLADQGCDIINCSWGSFGYSQFGQDMVDYALSKNSLIVAAAGNNNRSTPYYPAAFEGVLAVASIDSNLTKSGFSNYGYWVDVVAPGSGIYSTRADGTYGYLSGTSMASPMVAGALAILKSEHPSLSARQLAERLKATALPIDGLVGNSSYRNQLGAGLIQMHEALVAPFTSPAVDWSDPILTDSNDNSFIASDTIFLGGKFTNYLAPSGDLKATCALVVGDAQVLSDTFDIGVLNTNFQSNNYQQPFRIIPDANASFNDRVVVEVRVWDDQDTFFFYEEFNIMVDYINLNQNKLGLTVNSKGMLGYNDFNQSAGIGFTHESFFGSLLYEGGLMVGAEVDGQKRVVDRIRSGSGSRDQDFSSLELIHYISNDSTQVARIRGTFHDSTAASHDSIGLWIEQEYWLFDEANHDEYIIAKYTIVNRGSQLLKKPYAGIFMDFDIDDYSKNWTKKINDRPLMISWSNNSSAPVVGVGTLEQFNFNGYAIDNDTDTDKDVSPILGYPTQDKYITLSQNRDAAGTVDGNDIIQVVSRKLDDLAPGDTAVAYFAFVASTSETSVLEAFDSAYTRFNGLNFSGLAEEELSSVRAFPNPAADELQLTGLSGISDIQLFDLSGRIILRFSTDNERSTIDLSTYPSGLYTLVIRNDKTTNIIKVIHR